MIVRFTESQIMDVINQDVIGWTTLYEKLGVLDLPWGDIRPDVQYFFMSQRDQIKIVSLWKEMIKKTKDKRFKVYRKEYRSRIISWEDLCYRPSYADDLDCMFMIDTERQHQGKFDLGLELKEKGNE